MRETILTLILCINLSISAYAQGDETIAEPVNIEQEVQNKIDQLDKSDLEQWFIQYKQIQAEYSDVLDPDETIYDIIDQDEIGFFYSIVEAEAGITDWEGKVRVANVIINRLKSDKFADTITKVLKEKIGGSYQFTTYANGSYKKVKISEDTKLAVEYAFQFPDITGGALYFNSGYSHWHETHLKFIFKDSWHKFYKEK